LIKAFEAGPGGEVMVTSTTAESDAALPAEPIRARVPRRGQPIIGEDNFDITQMESKPWVHRA
jgi:hypothetical protein